MSFAASLVPALHLLISLSQFEVSGGSLSSLEMKELLFVERRSHSTFELVREFFNRTLLPACDLTANLCDVNCCNDKDCNEDHISAFSCTRGLEPFSTDPILSDSMYCHSNDTTFVDPVLCYETENSPFLGVYFMEDRVLKRKWIETNLENVWDKRYFPIAKIIQPVRDKYMYGVPLRSTNENVVRLPRDILGNGYCDYGSPVRFLADTESVCTLEISPELCNSDPRLHLETYIEPGDEFKPPDIYSGGVPIMANITIECGHDTLETDDFVAIDNMLKACGNAMKIGRAEFDGNRRVCKNVVTRVEFHFSWRENTLVTLDVVVALSDVSTVQSVTVVPSRRGRNARVTQIFITNFYSLETNSGRRKHDSYRMNDEILLHHT